MRSFALWYSLKKKNIMRRKRIVDNKGKFIEVRKEVKVHVNLWNNVTSDKKEYYFDFGFLVEDITDIGNIYLYCPFNLNKESIEDLGKIISNNNKLVNAIFNEDYTMTYGEAKKLIVNKGKNEPLFVLYSLDIENQINLKTCKGNSGNKGTILEIKVGDIKINSLSKYYFRLRIKVGSQDIGFVKDEIKGVSIFNSYFTNTEVIDFRLNDIRSCSDEVREQFDKGKKFGITAVHYLILRNVNDAIIHHGGEMTSRMLENYLWRSYISVSNRDIIAYHIRKKVKNDINIDGSKVYVDDFSDLTRFQYQKGTAEMMCKYLIVALILGAIAGVGGNILTKWIGLS